MESREILFRRYKTGNKLELTWYGKEQEISVEPRLLIERAELSNTAAAPDTENMLIHGDNLLALKALESRYKGQIKCIYIARRIIQAVHLNIMTIIWNTANG